MTQPTQVPDHPTDFAISVIASDGGAVVDVCGEIDAATAPTLSAAIDCVPAVARTHVIVDLSNVTFIDSSGLSALVNARSRLVDHDMAMTVTNLQPAVAKLFRITGLDAVLLDDTNETAAAMAQPHSDRSSD